MTALLWFRRDLRLSDHPALVEAAAQGPVVPVFVIDPVLTRSPGRRLDRLLRSVAALREATGGALVVRSGAPATVIPQLADETGADSVHISVETTPYGRRRDRAVYDALTEREIGFVGTGSPYAVTPGRVLKKDGTPFQVFTPFSKAWQEHGWRAPAASVAGSVAGSSAGSAGGAVQWVDPPASEELPVSGSAADDGEVGEADALRRWQEWRSTELPGYGSHRNRPDLDSTSRLSVALKYGEIHPRTLLADLGPDDSRFRAELCWREFYADVLFHNPDSAWNDLRPLGIDYDEPKEAAAEVEAWKNGETGYPIVDAGMRQLRAEGWMHNRVRMITASFLCKDLHLPWQVGARHFLDELLDGDIASNNHGWQWVAGTGTDAAPYFRVFNPTLQGQRFDPQGDYVRRWIPELRHLAGAAAHEPWKHPDGHAHGYPAQIVDHAQARTEALARYKAR